MIVLLVLVLVLAVATSSGAEVVEVELMLPLPARLDLRDRRTVVVAPFMTVSFDGESSSEIGDVDVETRQGYRSEPFSTSSTATYYRQVLVERSGYEFDILMLVLDGKTGDLLFAENFKDFRAFDRARIDPLVGMYENLDALEDRIVGIFSQRWMRTTRSIFGH